MHERKTHYLSDEDYPAALTAHRVAKELLDPKIRQLDEELEAKWSMLHGPIIDKDSFPLVIK